LVANKFRFVLETLVLGPQLYELAALLLEGAVDFLLDNFFNLSDVLLRVVQLFFILITLLDGIHVQVGFLVEFLLEISELRFGLDQLSSESQDVGLALAAHV